MSEVYKTKRKAPMIVGEHNVTPGYGIKEGAFNPPDYINTAWTNTPPSPMPNLVNPVWMNTNAQPNYWGLPVTIDQPVTLGQFHNISADAYLNSLRIDASGNLTLTVDPNYTPTTTLGASASFF